MLLAGGSFSRRCGRSFGSLFLFFTASDGDSNCGKNQSRDEFFHDRVLLSLLCVFAPKKAQRKISCLWWIFVNR